MQAKGLVQFFTVALVLVCIYQLSFTWMTASVEEDAREYAESSVGTGEENRDDLVAEKEQYYLDSVNNEIVFDLAIIDFTYQKTKERRI